MERDLGLRSATELLSLLNQREISSRELLEHYLTRNEWLGPDINAIVTLDVERARAGAKAADDRRARGDRLGALDGLPMTIKDALAVADVRSTGGAVELSDHVPDEDADVVARVRDAGAVVFGKTNLPRWSADAQATNEIFGTTNNPWDLTCGPGGSSGGAAAALAAGLTSLDIGTDIGGSVRLPAHFSGVCGHKPSFGVVSQIGYIDHVSYGATEADVNVVGPLGRSVSDLDLLFKVMVGPRPELAPAWRLDLPPARHDQASSFRVAAWLDDPGCPVGSEVAAVLERAVSAIESAGLAVDCDARPDIAFDDVRKVGLPLISAATSPGRTDEEFAELRSVALEPESATESMRMRSQGTAMFHRDWQLNSERRMRNRAKWAQFFEHHDVLLAPVAIIPAFEHQLEGTLYTRTLPVDGGERSYSDLIVWTSQFGYVGLPATVVPVGLTDSGKPVGIQIVGPYLEDNTTLRFAHHVEAICGGYQIPPMAI